MFRVKETTEEHMGWIRNESIRGTDHEIGMQKSREVFQKLKFFFKFQFQSWL